MSFEEYSFGDFSRPGEVRIETARQRFGPFLATYGTYKDILREWDSALKTGLVTLTDDDGCEHAYRCCDITEITWKPVDG